MPGTGVVIDGKRELIPGLDVENFFDEPSFRLTGEDVAPRSTRWLRQVVIHTTKGVPGGNDHRPQEIRMGIGPSMNAAERCRRTWSGSKSAGGAHLVIDFDGRITCFADLLTESAQHAGHVNSTSLGLEIYQGSDAEMYMEQLDVVVTLVDWLTARFGIQRMIPSGPYAGPIHRLTESVEDVVGVIGHRDVTIRRGRGDPGSKIFYMLGAAGYEGVSYELAEDRERWRLRQRSLGIEHPDGIAGPATVAKLKQAQFIPGIKGKRPLGLWVERPIDRHFLSAA